MPSRLSFSLPKFSGRSRSKSVDPGKRRGNSNAINNSNANNANNNNVKNGVALNITSSSSSSNKQSKSKRGSSVEPSNLGRSKNVTSSSSSAAGAAAVATSGASTGVTAGSAASSFSTSSGTAAAAGKSSSLEQQRQQQERHGNTNTTLNGSQGGGNPSSSTNHAVAVGNAVVTPDRPANYNANYNNNKGGTPSTINTTTPSSPMAFTMNDTSSFPSSNNNYNHSNYNSNNNQIMGMPSDTKSDTSGYESDFITAFHSPPSFTEDLLEDDGGIFPHGRNNDMVGSSIISSRNHNVDIDIDATADGYNENGDGYNNDYPDFHGNNEELYHNYHEDGDHADDPPAILALDEDDYLVNNDTGRHPNNKNHGEGFEEVFDDNMSGISEGMDNAKYYGNNEDHDDYDASSSKWVFSPFEERQGQQGQQQQTHGQVQQGQRGQQQSRDLQNSTHSHTQQYPQLPQQQQPQQLVANEAPSGRARETITTTEEERRNSKTPRMVSPSPSPINNNNNHNNTANNNNGNDNNGNDNNGNTDNNDDLRAWGIMPMDNKTNITNTNNNNNIGFSSQQSQEEVVFETNFFQNGFMNSIGGGTNVGNGGGGKSPNGGGNDALSGFGFDDHFGKDDNDDAFFGTSWANSNTIMDTTTTTTNNNSNLGNAWKQSDNDPFKQFQSQTSPKEEVTAVAASSDPMEQESPYSSPGNTTTTFERNISAGSSWAYSPSSHSNKIDSLVIPSSLTAPNTSFSKNQLAVGTRDPPAVVVPERKKMDPVECHVDNKRQSQHSNLHPLKQPPKQQQHQQNRQDNGNGEVVVSFEDFDGTTRTDSRKSSNRPRTRHRRVPSNGSAGSVGTFHSRRGKHPGSVGSSSSAVDQILEQYRQKRLAKSGKGLPQHSASLAHYNVGHSDQSLSKIIDNLETAASNGHANGHPNHIPPSGTRQPHRGPSPSPQSSTAGYSRNGLAYQPSLNSTMNDISERLRSHQRGLEESTGDTDRFLLANIEATMGPRGVAPDMESLSGRSHRSGRSRHHHNRSPMSNLHHRTDASVDSRTSRHSFRSYRTNQSALSHMSKESQSVANDLFRLEAQLAEVAKQQQQEEEDKPPSNEMGIVVPSSNSDLSIRSNGLSGPSIIGAEPVPRPTPVEVFAPPGKLGILLANKSGQQGPTHVSQVRSESVLAGKVHVGDRFVSVDGEDVTRMNSKEITTIMARKSDFERVLVFIPLQHLSKQQEWI